jgi:hypothetical protein
VVGIQYCTQPAGREMFVVLDLVLLILLLVVRKRIRKYINALSGTTSMLRTQTGIPEWHSRKTPDPAWYSAVS